MMDFDNILNIASQNQGLSSVQKRYSLQAGPPKKDPKSKGVNPAAVQALLKKQHSETKKKETEMKKQKEELLAKRVELKSDRKARAMASRTKDNFKGYNGVPVVEGPKKRRSKLDMQEDQSTDIERFRNNSFDPEDDEDNYEYEQSDSEPEQEPERLRPGKTIGDSGRNNSNKSSSKKSCGPPKSGPPLMNFADLLRLAETKQFEPVELKPKVVRKEERLHTADEIRELEMERKAKRQDKDRDSKAERGKESKSQSSSVRNTLDKEQKNCKPQKNSLGKPNLNSESGKKLHPALTNNGGQSSSKPSVSHRDRPTTSHSNRDRSKTSMSNSSGTINGNVPLKATSSQVSTKQVCSNPSSSHKSSTSSDLTFKKESSVFLQGRASGIARSRPPGTSVTGQKSQHGSSQQTRPIQGSSVKQGPTVGGSKSGINSAVKSSGNSVMRPSLGGPPRPACQPQARPGGTLQAKSGGSRLQDQLGGSGNRPPGIGPGRPSSGGQVPGRSTGSTGSGPGRPKCTVVSETISSKNVGGPTTRVPPRPGMPQRPGMAPRPGMPQRPGMAPIPGMPQRPGMAPIPGMPQRPGMAPRPGMPQRPGMAPRPGMPQRPGMAPRPGMPQRPGMAPRPGMPPRPMMHRPPGTMLPPITSAYKRKYEDEEDEYDSELDDFIDDGGEEQEEISRHIKEIFGYDRNKYKNESDYALKFMESSWKDVQKEEARSLRLAVQEDLEEEKREEEEINKKNPKRQKKN